MPCLYILLSVFLMKNHSVDGYTTALRTLQPASLASAHALITEGHTQGKENL